MLGTPNREAERHGSASLDLGFRRIWAVRVERGADRTRYEVEGVVHRHPVRRAVTAAMAARLADAGVPVLVRHAAVPGGRSC